MQGRFHIYEGYSASEVVFPIRVMEMLGIKLIMLTNAAGGVNLSYEKGQLILLDDHILLYYPLMRLVFYILTLKFLKFLV